MKINRIFLVGIFSGLAFTSCRDSNEAGRGFEVDESVDYERVEVEGEPEEENNVDILIRSNGNLTTFAETLEKNQFHQNWGETGGQGTVTKEESVSEEGISGSRESSSMTGEKTSEKMNGYTIFAPSDDAFDRLPEDQRNAILNTNNREENLSSINYLMVDQRLPQERFKEQIRSLTGNFL